MQLLDHRGPFRDGYLVMDAMACESIRFDPTAASGAGEALVSLTQDLVHELGRLKAT